MEFRKANLTIAEVAEAMHCDSQTIRVMLQQGIVPWGKAWKRPGSSHYTYIISPKGFYEATGMVLGGVEDD